LNVRSWPTADEPYLKFWRFGSGAPERCQARGLWLVLQGSKTP